MRRRGFLGASVASVLAGQTRPRAAEARGVVFVPRSMPASLDPIATPSFATRTAALAVFETLYGTDAALNPMPQMAAAHRTEDDDKQWTIQIRGGLSFHDGAPVTAEDCVASLRRWMLRDRVGQTLATRLDSLRATDARTLEIRLTKPLRQIPLMLTKSSTSPPVMMPARLAATKPDTPVDHPIGCGPFQLDPASWRPGEAFSLTRFAGYVPRTEETNFTGGRRVAAVDRVTWRAETDPLQAIRSGRADWVEQLPPDLADTAFDVPGFTSGRLIDPGYFAVLRLNTTAGPTADLGLRQAILATIDQTAVMEKVFGVDSGKFTAPVGVFPTASGLANDAGVEKTGARQSVKTISARVRATGYDGTPLDVLIPTDDPVHAAMTQAVVAHMTEIGLVVRTHPICQALVDGLRRGDRVANLEAGVWSGYCESVATTDQLDPLAALLGADRESIRLRESWIDLLDPAGDLKLGPGLQGQVFANAPFVPLGQWVPASAWRASLTGLQTGPFPVFWGVSRSDA